MSIQPVEVPEGLSEPDVSAGLQIPERDPEAPPRSRNDPCLDKPPKFFEEEAKAKEPAGN